MNIFARILLKAVWMIISLMDPITDRSEKEKIITEEFTAGMKRKNIGRKAKRTFSHHIRKNMDAFTHLDFIKAFCVVDTDDMEVSCLLFLEGRKMVEICIPIGKGRVSNVTLVSRQIPGSVGCNTKKIPEILDRLVGIDSLLDEIFGK